MIIGAGRVPSRIEAGPDVSRAPLREARIGRQRLERGIGCIEVPSPSTTALSVVRELRGDHGRRASARRFPESADQQMKNGKPKFKIQLQGTKTKPARAFKFNPLNYRLHGDAQRAALRTMLGDVGWVGAVLENKRTGNLIDGHARIEEALRDDPDRPVPYLVVDLTPAEEKAVLATLDPIGAMADVDPDLLDQLYRKQSSPCPVFVPPRPRLRAALARALL